MTSASPASMRPRFRIIDGLPVRFAESGTGPAPAEEALLLSPWPQSMRGFERMWPRLAERARLVAIELPGFGDSGHRDALMTPRAVGEFVVRAADAFGLRHPHVIGPAIATGAALFAAALHPGRLRSVVVGSGGAAVPLQLGGVLSEWVEAPGLQLLPPTGERPIATAGPGGREGPALPDAAPEDRLSAYAAERFVESMRYVRDSAAELLLLRDLLREIRTPVLVVAGRRDPLLPLANAELLVERLPESRLAVLDAGHVTREDAADEFAALVGSWWEGGCVAPARAARDRRVRDRRGGRSVERARDGGVASGPRA